MESYPEIPDKAKRLELILASIPSCRRQDRKARSSAASTEHWGLCWEPPLPPLLLMHCGSAPRCSPNPPRSPRLLTCTRQHLPCRFPSFTYRPEPTPCSGPCQPNSHLRVALHVALAALFSTPSPCY